MTAEELWEKYAAHRGNGYPTMDKPDFLAALAEREAYVKKECAKLQRKRSTERHGYDKYDDAAAIERMEIK